MEDTVGWRLVGAQSREWTCESLQEEEEEGDDKGVLGLEVNRRPLSIGLDFSLRGSGTSHGPGVILHDRWRRRESVADSTPCQKRGIGAMCVRVSGVKLRRKTWSREI